MLKWLRSLSVSAALLVVAGVGFLSLVAVSSAFLLGETKSIRLMHQDTIKVQLSRDISGLTHELQKERGMSAGFVSSQGASFGDSLKAQRLLSDEAIAAFRVAGDMLIADVTNKSIAAQFEGVTSLIDQITTMRNEVDALSITVPEVVGSFTRINRETIDLMPLIARDISHAPTARAIQRQALFMRAKDLSGLERATGATGLSLVAGGQETFPPALLSRLNGLIRDQDLLFLTYAQMASVDMAERMNALNRGAAGMEVARYRTLFQDQNPDVLKVTSGADWFEAITAKINLIKEIEDAGSAEIAALISDGLSEARAGVFKKLAMMVFVAASLGALVWIITSSTRQSMIALVGHVDDISGGKMDTPTPKCPQMDLGQLASALSAFQRSEKQRLDALEMEELQSQASARQIEETLHDVAEGQFSARILSDGLTGLAKILGDGINQILDVTERVVQEQAKKDFAEKAAAEGDLKIQQKAVQEINRMVDACAAGDFGQRLSIQSNDAALIEVASGINKIAELSETSLEGLQSVLNALAEGRLDARAEGSFKGRFADMAHATNLAMEKMSGLIQEIEVSSTSLGTASADLKEGASLLTRSAETQASAVVQSSDATQALSKSVQETAQSMDRGKTLLAELGKSAHEMEAVAEDAVSSMADIENASGEMAKIVATIEGIAFQTNLLALNASVEAARAGAAGKGFSVVATEVRSLAGRCADASQQVGALIQDNVSFVQQGAELVRETGTSVQEMRRAVEETLGIVVSAAEGTELQTQSLTELKGAMEQLDTLAQDNSALAQKNASITSTLSQNGTQLTQSVSHFSLGFGSTDARSMTSPNAA